MMSLVSTFDRQYKSYYATTKLNVFVVGLATLLLFAFDELGTFGTDRFWYFLLH